VSPDSAAALLGMSKLNSIVAGVSPATVVLGTGSEFHDKLELAPIVRAAALLNVTSALVFTLKTATTVSLSAFVDCAQLAAFSVHLTFVSAAVIPCASVTRRFFWSVAFVLWVSAATLFTVHVTYPAIHTLLSD